MFGKKTTNSQESVKLVLMDRGSLHTVGTVCENGRFLKPTARVGELWMVRVVYRRTKMKWQAQEDQSQRLTDWYIRGCRSQGNRR